MSQPEQPQAPDYAAAAANAVNADLDTYPMKYLVEAASRMGGKVTIAGKEYDFTGLGDADTAAVMSDQMAQTLLDIQKDLGPQYIAQRIAELKQADPNGYAARKDLFDRIMAQAEAQPDRPLAENLQNDIVGQLQRAGRLDARELSAVQQAVRGGQAARGNTLGPAATRQEAGAVVQAGNARRDQQQQSGLDFLNSGVTPEDVEYRRIQQSLANLGAFIGGTTPISQFQQLSGAGNGAAPFLTPGYNTQGTNPNAAAQGIQDALAIYSGNLNWSQQQVNPYLAGTSLALNAAATGVNLGWRPFATPAAAPAGSFTGDINTPAWTAGVA